MRPWWPIFVYGMGYDDEALVASASRLGHLNPSGSFPDLKAARPLTGVQTDWTWSATGNRQQNVGGAGGSPSPFMVWGKKAGGGGGGGGGGGERAGIAVGGVGGGGGGGGSSRLNNFHNDVWATSGQVKRILLANRDKESMLEEIMDLKRTVADLGEQLKMARVRAVTVEMENRKLEKDLTEVEMQGLADGPRTGGAALLRSKLMTLKERLADLQAAYDTQNEELNSLRRDVRVTYVRELEIERSIYAEEVIRLQRLVRRMEIHSQRGTSDSKEATKLRERASRLENANHHLEQYILALNRAVETANRELIAHREKTTQLLTEAQQSQDIQKDLQDRKLHLEATVRALQEQTQVLTERLQLSEQELRASGLRDQPSSPAYLSQESPGRGEGGEGVGVGVGVGVGGGGGGGGGGGRQGGQGGEAGKREEEWRERRRSKRSSPGMAAPTGELPGSHGTWENATPMPQQSTSGTSAQQGLGPEPSSSSSRRDSLTLKAFIIAPGEAKKIVVSGSGGMQHVLTMDMRPWEFKAGGGDRQQLQDGEIVEGLALRPQLAVGPKVEELRTEKYTRASSSELPGAAQKGEQKHNVGGGGGNGRIQELGGLASRAITMSDELPSSVRSSSQQQKEHNRIIPNELPPMLPPRPPPPPPGHAQPLPNEHRNNRQNGTHSHVPEARPQSGEKSGNVVHAQMHEEQRHSRKLGVHGQPTESSPHGGGQKGGNPQARKDSHTEARKQVKDVEQSSKPKDNHIGTNATRAQTPAPAPEDHRYDNKNAGHGKRTASEAPKHSKRTASEAPEHSKRTASEAPEHSKRTASEAPEMKMQDIVNDHRYKTELQSNGGEKGGHSQAPEQRQKGATPKDAVQAQAHTPDENRTQTRKENATQARPLTSNDGNNSKEKLESAVMSRQTPREQERPALTQIEVGPTLRSAPNDLEDRGDKEARENRTENQSRSRGTPEQSSKESLPTNRLAAAKAHDTTDLQGQGQGQGQSQSQGQGQGHSPAAKVRREESGKNASSSSQAASTTEEGVKGGILGGGDPPRGKEHEDTHYPATPKPPSNRNVEGKEGHVKENAKPQTSKEHHQDKPMTGGERAEGGKDVSSSQSSSARGPGHQGVSAGGSATHGQGEGKPAPNNLHADVAKSNPPSTTHGDGKEQNIEAANVQEHTLEAANVRLHTSEAVNVRLHTSEAAMNVHLHTSATNHPGNLMVEDGSAGASISNPTISSVPSVNDRGGILSPGICSCGKQHEGGGVCSNEPEPGGGDDKPMAEQASRTDGDKKHLQESTKETGQGQHYEDGIAQDKRADSGNQSSSLSQSVGIHGHQERTSSDTCSLSGDEHKECGTEGTATNPANPTMAKQHPSGTNGHGDPAGMDGLGHKQMPSREPEAGHAGTSVENHQDKREGSDPKAEGSTKKDEALDPQSHSSSEAGRGELQGG
ncbi:hypothetical protein CBR_g36891 [Chara braunii]|uniref:Uncharacterized protein n=1 Tax=Chara braunii TaxID=69332 RepID=A0A388LLR6_CHABU|nr:hypothetical protein CBR_g36891 [Chara braunii]|eukprot:GBG83276.1 hypothetical protein CBR_g36891 [Chara braunii]